MKPLVTMCALWRSKFIFMCSWRAGGYAWSVLVFGNAKYYTINFTSAWPWAIVINSICSFHVSWLHLHMLKHRWLTIGLRCPGINPYSQIGLKLPIATTAAKVPSNVFPDNRMKDWKREWKRVEVTNEHLRSDDFMNFKSRCAARRWSEGLGLCDIHQRWCPDLAWLEWWMLRLKSCWRLQVVVAHPFESRSLKSHRAKHTFAWRILDLSKGEGLMGGNVVISRYSNVYNVC